MNTKKSIATMTPHEHLDAALAMQSTVIEAFNALFGFTESHKLRTTMQEMLAHMQIAESQMRDDLAARNSARAPLTSDRRDIGFDGK